MKFYNMKTKNHAKKMEMYYFILNSWLKAEQNGIRFSWFFKKHGYQRIGVYGCAELGDRVWDGLKNKKYEVYMIDRNAQLLIGKEYTVIHPDEEHIPDIDVLVITADFYYEKIKKEMVKKVTCPIISLKAIVDDLFSVQYPVEPLNEEKIW